MKILEKPLRPCRAGMLAALTLAILLTAGAAPDSTSPSVAATDSALDLTAALKRYPLTESAKPVRELVPGWTPPTKMVVVTDKPERAAWLQQGLPPGVQVVGVANGAEAKSALPGADAYILADDCTTETLRLSGKLKWLHSGAGGADQCLLNPDIASGKILLTNSQKVKSDGLAESAFGFIFALARNLDVALDNQRQKSLDAIRGRRGVTLQGATMLVVGLGGAGTEIARIGHELGMTVIATRNSSHDGPDYVEYVGLSDELPNLIGRADIVVVAAPITPETRGMFNAAMFSKMKRGAMFVDFTRAEIVVADDLAAALRNGQVGAAGLAWATYTPLPKDSPLWSAPNLILTPWGGAGPSAGSAVINPGVNPNAVTAPSATARTRPRPVNPQLARDNELRWLLIRENMRRYAAGEKMYSVFDLQRGY